MEEIEEYRDDKFSSGVWKKIFKLVFKSKKSVIIMIISVIMLAALDVLSPLLNAKVLDVFSSLSEYTQYIDIFDPWVDVVQFYKEHGIRVYNESNDLDNKYDAIILAVSHKQFHLLNFDVLRKEN